MNGTNGKQSDFPDVALVPYPVIVAATKGDRLCAKEIIGNRANLTKWQDDFHACMVEQYPDLERGGYSENHTFITEFFKRKSSFGLKNFHISSKFCAAK